MLKYIIRLDDACLNMDKKKWDKVERILDQHSITPIVGIIPDNKDPEFDHPRIRNFWKIYPRRWQQKKWIIAQHGLHHNISKVVRTEYSGHSYDEQKNNLKQGKKILEKHKVKPDCFFAPAHNFDNTTIDACRDLGYFKFISDGNAFYPYIYRGVMFLPNIFDTPHKIAKQGIFTFVYHPNNMEQKDFIYLDNFIRENKDNFNTNIQDILKKYNDRKKDLRDRFVGLAIFVYRIIKRTKR